MKCALGVLGMEKMSETVRYRVWVEALGRGLDSFIQKLPKEIESANATAALRLLSSTAKLANEMMTLQGKACDADKQIADANAVGEGLADKKQIEQLRHQTAERLSGVTASLAAEGMAAASADDIEPANAANADERLVDHGAGGSVTAAGAELEDMVVARGARSGKDKNRR